MCIQLLLVSVLLLAFVSPFSSSREFSGFTPHIAFKLTESLFVARFSIFPFNLSCLPICERIV